MLNTIWFFVFERFWMASRTQVGVISFRASLTSSSRILSGWCSESSAFRIRTRAFSPAWFEQMNCLLLVHKFCCLQNNLTTGVSFGIFIAPRFYSGLARDSAENTLQFWILLEESQTNIVVFEPLLNLLRIRQKHVKIACKIGRASCRERV